MINSTEDIFVIDCWIDDDSKRADLINLIERVRTYNIPIVLTGHYPVSTDIQKMVDYYLFDKKNPLLRRDEFSQYGINSVRLTESPQFRIENHHEFHQDYAIWETMRNAFNFCKGLGVKYIHFLEYDNLPDRLQYRQAFMERIREFHAVIYEYDKNSSLITNENPYCSTFIFSIRTDIAVQTIATIKNKEEFFVNKFDRWQLEKNFLNSLRKVTASIHVSSYIPNESELNIQAAWNRDGLSRNGTNLQIYPAVDENDDMYLHIIAKHDHYIEIIYGDYKKFHQIKNGDYQLFNIGKYQLLQTIQVFHQGIEIFKETLNSSLEVYRELNKVTWKSKGKDVPKEVNINFIDSPFVEVKGEKDHKYHIEFINTKTNVVEYGLDLQSNHWARSAKKYYTDWLIKIKGINNDFYIEHRFNPEGKRVFITFESKSLGDTLAWIGYVEKYRVDNRCEVICSTFHNNLFRKQYPKIEFTEPGTTIHNIYALYRLGVFFKDSGYDEARHPSDPKKEPLTKIASDILGLDFIEVRPSLPILATEKKKVVSIAIHATAQCKYWNNPNGWQKVVDFLNTNGYEVKLLSKEEDGYMGNKNPRGVTTVPPGKIEDVIKIIQESELFIGVSSGLAWVSWGVGTETILISGFTDIFTEPTIGIRRVINKSVCNSCWSDFTFDPGDWNWCPRHKGTSRQFECSKTITPEQVIEHIKLALKL